eukprot:5431769-Amphidinium_carterae.1
MDVPNGQRLRRANESMISRRRRSTATTGCRGHPHMKPAHLVHLCQPTNNGAFIAADENFEVLVHPTQKWQGRQLELMRWKI